MLYVGLDVHSKQSSLCILNSAGGTVNQIQLKGPRGQPAAMESQGPFRSTGPLRTARRDRIRASHRSQDIRLP